MLIDHFNRTIVIRRTDNRQNRPENLLLIDFHVGRHMVEQTRAHEKALLISLNFRAGRPRGEGSKLLQALQTTCSGGLSRDSPRGSRQRRK